jgi:hypothetical protein
LLKRTLHAVNPRRVVLNHWDDFTRPLSQPLRPMLATRVQGLTGWPPIRRLDPAAFARQVQALLPAVEVLVPEIFREYA